MHDGWYATGDLGIREQKGNISICGRKKWIIKKNGQLINPLSIERRITNKLGTDKVFVVGITDSIRGEAIVFLTTLSKSEWNNIKDKVLAVLAVHEKPRQTIHVSEVPLTKTKKIDRIRLSELANKKCVDKLAA